MNQPIDPQRETLEAAFLKWWRASELRKNNPLLKTAIRAECWAAWCAAAAWTNLAIIERNPEPQGEAPTPPVKESLTTAPEADVFAVLDELYAEKPGEFQSRIDAAVGNDEAPAAGDLGDAWNALADAMHAMGYPATSERDARVLAYLEKSHAIVQAALRPAPITQGAGTPKIIPTDVVPPGTIAMIQDGKVTGMITNLAPEGSHPQAPEGGT